MRDMRKIYNLVKKELKVQLLFVLGLVFAISANSQTPVYNYNFDDTYADAQGNGGDATAFGNASFFVGHNNSGVQFDGDDATYVQLPDGIISTFESMSVTAWINVNTVQNWNRVWDFGTGTDNYVFMAASQGTDGTLNMEMRTPTTNVGRLIGPVIPVGEWVHVAFTLDGTTSTGILYMNGIEVARSTSYSLKPSDLGITTQNFVGESQWPDANFNGMIDELQIFDVALTANQVLNMASVYPTVLTDAWSTLDLADYTQNSEPLSSVTSDLLLPSDLGNGIGVVWSSNNERCITSEGVVTQNQNFLQTVVINAKVGLDGDTLTKDFVVTVPYVVEPPLVLAHWDFSLDNIYNQNDTIFVTDTEFGYTANLQNDASIRYIGETDQYTVVDLGAGTGYVDLGEDIGKTIYNVSDYSMSIFFRIENDWALSPNGNFIWSFSNSEDITVPRDAGFYMILTNCHYSITDTWYQTSQDVPGGKNPSDAEYDGSWHHVAYVQEGTTGTVYLDGVQIAQQSTITKVPSSVLPLEGREGTLANWLGRSPYPADKYLTNTLLYGYQMFSVVLTADDVNALAHGELLDPVGIDQLNAAYAENPNYISQDLENEKNNLNLGDLSNVTTNLTLPTQGTLNPNIKITWTSEAPGLVSPEGVVTQRYFASTTYITATLTDPLGAKADTTFTVTVPASGDPWFTNDLLVQYDFTQVNGNVVTDVAEKHFEGEMMNGASIRTIGLDPSTFDVLDLGSNNGYFDMGVDMGEISYHLDDYSIGAYYLVDTSNTTLGSNGNFLWSIANSNNSLTDMNGYFFGGLNAQVLSISKQHYSTAQNVAYNQEPIKGVWHHLGYTQQDTIGKLYVDGVMVASDSSITYTPDSIALDGRFGTFYNWLGRSCYSGDAYLQNSLVYDFRLYGRALTDAEVADTEMGVIQTLVDLNAAYEANPNIPDAIKPVTLAKDRYTILSGAGKIRILGLGNEQVSVYNLAGQKMSNSANTNEIAVSSGIYIVKIGNVIKKVIVR